MVHDPHGQPFNIRFNRARRAERDLSEFLGLASLTVQLLEKYHDRFLFGTDNVAPADQAAQLRAFHLRAVR